MRLYLTLGIKIKKHCVLEFDQSKWLKPYSDLIQKNNRSRKNGDKDGEVFYKLMKNTVLDYLK